VLHLGIYLGEEPFLHYPPLDLEVVAALKDELRITNDEWPKLVKALRLADGNTLHYIRLTQEKVNEKMPVVPTLKFCFDGATMTSGERLQQEVGAFNLLYPNFTVAQVKTVIFKKYTLNHNFRPSLLARHTSFCYTCDKQAREREEGHR